MNAAPLAILVDADACPVKDEVLKVAFSRPIEPIEWNEADEKAAAPVPPAAPATPAAPTTH